MENNIGVRIRELRKKKGLTQEALASLLSVTSQAVSKWEMNTACPDISLLPMIAGIFEVSIDTLFGYEKNELEKRIDTILQKVNQYNRFWNRPDEAEQILKDGLKEYPSNSRLLSQLMELYECHMRNNRDITHLDDIIR